MNEMRSPVAEDARLAALHRYHILDTAPEQEYDALVELAAAICGTPMAMLTFVDREQQWYKASVGIPRQRSDRNISFCTHTITQPNLLVVPDMTCDARFAENPYVVHSPHVRFYAGMPLLTADGHALGTLCVVDLEPRSLTETQSRALEALGRQAMSLLTLRVTVARLEENLRESAQAQAALRNSEASLRETDCRLQAACQAGQISLWTDDLQALKLGAEKEAQNGTLQHVLRNLYPGDRKRMLSAYAYAVKALSPLHLEVRVQDTDHAIRWLLIRGEVYTDSQGRAAGISGSSVDITERKHSEEALSLSEQRLRSVVLAAPLILFSLDGEGKFTVSEGKGLERLGLSPGEVVGRSAYEVYRHSPEVLEHLERAYGGEAFSDRFDLGERTLDIWYSPEFDPSGHVESVIGVACDITEKQQAEKALHSSEARFQAFMDNIPTFAYVKDDQGRYVYCNDAFARLSQLSAEECLGKTALDLWPGPVGRGLHANTLEALSQDRLTETFSEAPDQDGGLLQIHAFRFTFRDSAGTLFVGCIALDVTEQKRAERDSQAAQRELEETLSQLNATLESTADGLLVVSTQGEIMCANGMFYEMWQIPEEYVKNRDDAAQLAFLVGQLADPEAFLARVQHLYSHPEETSFEVLTFKDGRIFERYSRPLLLQGAPAGRVWSFRDVTAQEQTRQDLIRAKNHALASVQAKSEFLANMSHEIRTPMNGILGMTTLLLATPLLPQQKHHAATIKNSADSLLTVINDILDFSKIEAGKLSLESVPFSLAQVMQEVKDLLEPRAAEKKLALLSSLPPDFPPCLSGDPARLRQILTNLVGNALKFTERGQVELEAGVLRETPTHLEFRLAVRDTGIGIPKDRQEAIFDSFTQADGSITRRYGGTGLGLAICLRLTDLMAGRIGLQSEPGKGSEFWLSITLEKTTATTAQPSPSSWPTDVHPLGLRVLLTEDNLINQEVARGFLEMWGCTVHVAENGWQACLATRTGSYDLVLMDIQMPEMDGRQATAEIRARERGTPNHLPIIAMTAHNMQGDREQCLACGMDDYISKPIDPDALLTALIHWGKPVPVAAEPLPPAISLHEPEPPKSFSAVLAAELPTEPETLPVLDIERLHRSCAGKAALERRIMTETQRLTPEILTRLRAAVLSGDAVQSRFEAHTLKGSSRTLGAEALGNAAALLEDDAKRGDLENASALLEQIEGDWTRLDTRLKDCLTRAPWKADL